MRIRLLIWLNRGMMTAEKIMDPNTPAMMVPPPRTAPSDYKFKILEFTSLYPKQLRTGMQIAPKQIRVP